MHLTFPNRQRLQSCFVRAFVCLSFGLLFLSIGGPVAYTQEPPPETSASASPVDDSEAASGDSAPIIFPHREWDRLWLSGQVNFISQYHPAFTSPYRGQNSLSPGAQDATSRVLTLFTGLRVTSTTEFLCVYHSLPQHDNQVKHRSKN